MKHVQNLRLIVKENCIYRSYCFIMMMKAQSLSTVHVPSLRVTKKQREFSLTYFRLQTFVKA